LLTGDPRYLTPYTNGRLAALPELDAVDDLIGDDAVQNAHVAKARENAVAKLAELDATVALMRQGRADLARASILSNSSASTMDAVRDSVQQLQIIGNRHLQELGKNEQRRRLLASIGILIALAGLAFAAWQQLRMRQRRSAMLALTNMELEKIVGTRTQQLENERLRIEALLRDVSHRVGNNLAMVSALLNVQSRQSQEPAVREALAQAQSRIQAIAAGQRRLRLDVETDEIDARPYMEDLLAEIGKAAEGRAISLKLDMGDIRLPGKDAVSFVVIVNELVTNAIKHAFPEDETGTIVVRLRESRDDSATAITLTVEDDGVGMASDVATKGLGQTVVASLIRSMRATMTSEAANPGLRRPGLRVALSFPKRA